MVSTNLLTMWPQGLFGMNASVAEQQGTGWMQSAAQLEDGGGRKRARDDGSSSDGAHCNACCAGGSRTPTLVCSRRRHEVGVNDHQIDHDTEDRPIKRFRGERVIVAVSAPKAKKTETQPQSGLVGTLPEDVVSHCLSFLNSVEDRFALQTTCKQFRRISNSDKMLMNIQVGGDRETGKHGIIQEEDTPESAAVALAPFSQAGNLEAIYM
jgi:hypothetical protein